MTIAGLEEVTDEVESELGMVEREATRSAGSAVSFTQSIFSAPWPDYRYMLVKWPCDL